jgi:hypothetical protein
MPKIEPENRPQILFPSIFSNLSAIAKNPKNTRLQSIAGSKIAAQKFKDFRLL